MDDKALRVEALKQRKEKLDKQSMEHTIERLTADLDHRNRRFWKQRYEQRTLSALSQLRFSKRERRLLGLLIKKEFVTPDHFSGIGYTDPKSAIYALKRKIKSYGGQKSFRVESYRASDVKGCYWLIKPNK